MILLNLYSGNVVYHTIDLACVIIWILSEGYVNLAESTIAIKNGKR